MTIEVIEPSDPVFTWADLKAALRIDGDDERNFVLGLAASALVWIGDSKDGWLGRAIGQQKIAWRPECWPDNPLSLPVGPVRRDLPVTISVVDPTGVTQPFAAFSVLSEGRLILSPGAGWPATNGQPESIVVTYFAGEEDVPAPLRTAMLLLIAHWYRNREAVGDPQSALPLGFEDLLSTYRRWRF